MPNAKNTKLVAHIDCPGGGQVWVEGTTLFIGHMRPPSGTSIVDVADPANPRPLARVEIPAGWHSHKVRVANGIMLVNHERQGQDGGTAEFLGKPAPASGHADGRAAGPAGCGAGQHPDH